ncbi:hypothetical protein BT63DRAFT_424377 [Microthyrium microscopicum]|uniref:Uncharacterized protein n=1 Tax=Microthyrium microscopicum TaxID=703497 RepID=A0A6A6UG75_9PEZI|nr:hypothetical protein BT63DRAFT_424377 [Microthyrium microscopicum]
MFSRSTISTSQLAASASSRMAYYRGLRRSCPPGTRIASVKRQFHETATTKYARKDSQDKDSIKPESSEYAQGSSDDVAAKKDVAFDPNTTDPHQEKKDAGKGEEGNALENSPANSHLGKPKKPKDLGQKS